MNTCCFIGHRIIKETQELKKRIRNVIEELIVKESINTFLFGSKSSFDSLCLDIVTGFKYKYPHIKLIYVRAEFPYINDHYMEYLMKLYDETYYPEKQFGAGKAVYVERNREMIDKSRFCVIYYDENNRPDNRTSGTAVSLEYAAKKGKEIIIFP